MKKNTHINKLGITVACCVFFLLTSCANQNEQQNIVNNNAIEQNRPLGD